MRDCNCSRTKEAWKLCSAPLGFIPTSGLTIVICWKGRARSGGGAGCGDAIAGRPGRGLIPLLLQASSGSGKLFSTPAEIRFQVLPPYWQRWWFFLLCTAVTTLIVWRLYAYRVNRLLELERIRTRIAADLHDEVGSGLSQIALLSEVARLKLQGREEQEAASLNRIAGVSRQLVESMSDIVWAIRPDQDSSADLVQRIRRHASDLLTECGIELEFIEDDSQKPHQMGADLRREVLLIFKEALNNIVKHAHCSFVEVQIEFVAGSLRGSIRDDGQGFDRTQCSSGNGLANMQRRAEKFGWKLDGSLPARGRNRGQPENSPGSQSGCYLNR